jgi:signal transduction histidine kinase
MHEMAASEVFEPDARVGSPWLAAAGDAERDALLIALLSRFNHDLRTPLNTVVGWTHLLQQGSVDNARLRHVADVLARNAREQTVLLDEFVDDARALLGALKLDPVALPLDDLVARAVERAAPLLALHGVTCSPALRAGNASVTGDERRLARLVYRLLAAAVRRAREGSEVELTAARTDGQLRCRFASAAGTPDWSDALLLDLRICAYVAKLHAAEVVVERSADRAVVFLHFAASA